MAKAAQMHRHLMQKLEMIYPYLGWLTGSVGLLACVGGAVYLAMNNHEGVAGGLLGVPLLGVVGWFVQARLSLASVPVVSNSGQAQRGSAKRKR